ncbi:MAG: hypothetical protein QGG36_00575, partial [Pirellulaceae bacterium]|nr:hypothetical protein [Pirellulaceae bacterium]
MEELRTQVKRAHRRLVLQRFLQASPWFLFTGFMIALVGVAVPKIWTIQVDQNIWLWSWVGGAAAVSLLMSIVWTVATRRGALDAAIELDKRFGLKERVSSTLSLAPDELETEAGQALVNDAIRRVARVDVKEHFRVRTTWRSLLPLVPAVAVFLVALLIADAAQKEKLQAATEKAAEIEAIKKSHDNLRKELKKKQRELEAKGLKDADALFREIDKKLGKIDNKSDVDKKKALIQLKNMEKSLDERRKQVGGANELKKQLQQLKNLEKGPAEELAKAMKNGDFKAAQNALEKLKEQVAKG